MSTELEVGAIVEGKVSGITKFGAFVTLPGGKSGLVHISEIAYTYVNDVKDLLTEGQDVKVKIIGIDENNRINLSIKKALPPPARPARGPRPARPGGDARPSGPASRPPRQAQAPREPATFDDMLKRFMSDSDSKLSGRYSDKGRSRRGNGRRN